MRSDKSFHNLSGLSGFLALYFCQLLFGYEKIDECILDRVRKIYNSFPQISVPQHLGDDDDVQQLSEALGAAKTRVEGCTSFLKAALK